ncbi:MAG: hypothetical protein GX801_10910 [Fibrobacter sp.]|nr:hypothetical protein [Fibrobacter sp.]
MIEKDIVVIGYGAITPVGKTLNESFENINLSQNGISKIKYWDVGECRAKYAGEVKHSDSTLLGLIGDLSSSKKVPMDRGELLLFKAVEDALNSTGVSRDYFNNKKIGLFYGTSLSGFVNLERDYIRNFKENKSVNPKSYISFSVSFALDRLAYEYGFSGPRICFSTACSSSLHAVIWGSRYLQESTIDVAICLGSDPLSMLSLTGFNSLDSLAEVKCSPFSEGDLGLSLGEGAGAVIMERNSCVKARSGSVKGFLAGYSCNSDAYHITASDPTGRGISNCINTALKSIKPGLLEENIFVAAHGTGTPHNDKVETRAIMNTFKGKENLLVSSAKASIGHTLGASGIIELALVLKSMEQKKAFPTVNFTKARSGCDLNYVQNKSCDYDFNLGVKNAFAFGGNNVSVAVTKDTKNVVLQNNRDKNVSIAITGAYQISNAGSGLPALFDAIQNSSNAFEESELEKGKLYRQTFSEATAKISDDLLKQELRKFRIKNARRMDRFTQIACVAALGCIKDAGLRVSPSNSSRIAIVANTHTGHINSVQQFYDGVLEKNYKTGDPSLFPNSVINAHIGHLTIETGIKGYTTVMSNADIGVVNSFMLAKSLLESDEADYVLLGSSTEYSSTFHKALKALGLTSNTIKPYSTDANGYVIGEASVFVMLEREDKAISRNAKISCLLDSVYTENTPVFPGAFQGEVNPLLNIYESHYSGDDFLTDAVFGMGKSIVNHDVHELKALESLQTAVPLLSTTPLVGYVPGVTPILNLAAWLSAINLPEVWQESIALCKNQVNHKNISRAVFNAITEGGSAGTFSMRLKV